MKKKNNLNYKQIRQLLNIVNISLVFKVITNEDIVYNDSEIKSINGITFKNGIIEIKKKIYSKNNVNLVKQTVDDNQVLYKNWLKLIKTLNT